MKKEIALNIMSALIVEDPMMALEFIERAQKVMKNEMENQRSIELQSTSMMANALFLATRNRKFSESDRSVIAQGLYWAKHLAPAVLNKFLLKNDMNSEWKPPMDKRKTTAIGDFAVVFVEGEYPEHSFLY